MINQIADREREIGDELPGGGRRRPLVIDGREDAGDCQLQVRKTTATIDYRCEGHGKTET